MCAERLWGSRLKESADEAFIRFISGRDVKGLPPCDDVLIPYDIWGSRAHAVMLWKQGIIPQEDARRLIEGLREVSRRYEAKQFSLDPTKEDVHTNVERFLIDSFGIAVGGKLHTARSRNDQVTVDMFLFLRDKALELSQGYVSLIETLLALSRRYAKIVVPGYTHHQHAMVTTFGHLLFSYAEACYRDLLRYRQWHTLFNANPLGGVASYGTGFPIDRNLTSRLLGFEKPSASSVDLITNRWEAEAELAYAASVSMNHLSSLAQTLILFTTTEFGFVSLSDRYCGGSSIMPQKRNPSALEVIKAKTAVVQGMLGSLLSMSRGFFVGYNRDSQWTKYVIMDLIHECIDAPAIMAAVLETLTVNKDRARELCERGFITATDLMESLINDFDLSMREGKILVERAVHYSDDDGNEVVASAGLLKAIQELGHSIEITPESVNERQDPVAVVARRKAVGGPAPDTVLGAVKGLSMQLGEEKAWLQAKRAHIERAKAELESIESALMK